MPNDLEQYTDLWKHARAFVIYRYSRQCFDPVLSSSSAFSSSEAVSRTFAFRTSHFAMDTMGWMYHIHPLRVRPCCPTPSSTEDAIVSQTNSREREAMLEKISQQIAYFLWQPYSLHTRCVLENSHLYSAYNAYGSISLDFGHRFKSISSIAIIRKAKNYRISNIRLGMPSFMCSLTASPSIMPCIYASPMNW